MAQIIFPLEIARQGRGGGGAVLLSFQRIPQTCLRYFPLRGHKEKPFAKSAMGQEEVFLLLSPTAYRGGGGGHLAVQQWEGLANPC